MSSKVPPALAIEDLRVSQNGARGTRELLSGINLTLDSAEVLGLVGGSGSGKSLTMLACMKLLPTELHVTGRIRISGVDLQTMTRARLADYRSRQVGYVHQDARSSMDPRRTVGDFLLESVLHARLLTFDEAFAAASALLRDVGVSGPEDRMRQYPHELSGGTLQRIMIVSALLQNPQTIYADEPTSALDVIAQSDVIAILLEQVRQRGMGLLLITHDLDLAVAACDRIAVMHEGRIVESGPAKAVAADPHAPFTRKLLDARLSSTTAGVSRSAEGETT